MTVNHDKGLDRWYSLFVLVFMLAIVYFLFFQSFFSEHSTLNEGIVDLEQSRQEYTELVDQIPELQKRIKHIKETVGDNTSFLIADSYNLGTSELTRLLKGIVANNAKIPADCRIQSNSPSKDKDQDQFEKITLKVRMQCQFPDMVNVLQDIETSIPQLFVDNLNLEQRTTRSSRSRRNITPTAPKLDVRFDLFAYMNKPIKARTER